MNTEKEQISAKQLMLSVGCFIQGSSLILNFATATTKQDSWIAAILGLLIAAPIFGIYFLLIKQFPGMNIIEITIRVFGKVLGRILSLIYIYYFFSLTFLNTEILGNFMNGFIMPETPTVVFYLMFIFVCVWAVRSGIENITRYSALFVFITFGALLITTVLSIKDLKTSNIFPIFSLPAMKYFQSSYTIALLPYCEVFTFFMLFPEIKDKNKIYGALIKGVLIGAITIFISILKTILMVGPLIAILSYPTYAAIRMIDIGNILTRMEVIFACILIILLFFKVTIILYATVKGIAQIFNLHSYKILTPSVGVLTVVFSLRSLATAPNIAYWGANVAAVYSSFFEILLPVMTLAVCITKKLLIKKG
ncbi:MAG: endospore germination permease [Oscillospiraceae bacterium]